VVLDGHHGYGSEKNVSKPSMEVVPTWVGACNFQPVASFMFPTAEGISHKTLVTKRETHGQFKQVVFYLAKTRSSQYHIGGT